MKCAPEVIAAAVDRFRDEQSSFEAAAESVGGRVQGIADAAQIRCRVEWRAKDVRSFHKKLVTKDYAAPWTDVTDKAGVRVVVQQYRQVDELVDRIKGDFANGVTGYEDKRVVHEPAKLAYSGVHLQVRAGAHDSQGHPIECEVQVRTAAQDAWSVMSHELLYKPLLEMPPKMRHAAYRLVALMEMFDEEVQRLVDALGNSPAREVEDLLRWCEDWYLELAHSPSNPELSEIVLMAVKGALSPEERENYKPILDAFVDAERQDLVALYNGYGPHSAVAYLPDYLLFGQAESLFLLERMSAKPHMLFDAWRRSGLPLTYLDALGEAAGIQFPGSRGLD